MYYTKNEFCDKSCRYFLIAGILRIFNILMYIIYLPEKRNIMLKLPRVFYSRTLNETKTRELCGTLKILHFYEFLFMQNTVEIHIVWSNTFEVVDKHRETLLFFSKAGSPWRSEGD